MQLDGKVALITGGTRGIGRGIAEAYLREGAKVAVNGRNTDKGEQALQEIGAGDRAAFLQGDVMKQSDVEAIVDGTVERFGRIDILVNNAGGSFDNANVVDANPDSFEAVLRWNVKSTFWATRRALQHMIPQRFGRIINMSSVEGKHGKPGISAYVTSKHAINGSSPTSSWLRGLAPPRPWVSHSISSSRCSLPSRQSSGRTRWRRSPR